MQNEKIQKQGSNARSSNLHYDVVVAGGGVAGCAAAIAAARSGARTLLIEQNAFLGGAATAGAVGQFVGWKTRKGRQVISGVAQDIVNRLRELGGCGEIEDFVMSTGNIMNRIEYHPELLKVVLDQLVSEAGADILFKSALIGCELQDQSVRSVKLWTANKTIEVSASTFIDASGDMALLVQAGAGFLALEEGQALQPGTMMFSLAPVDFAALDTLSPADRKSIVTEGLAAKALPRAAMHYSRSYGADAAWFNISRVSVDPLDPFSISRGEIEGRRQAMEASRFLIARVPGFSKARLSAFAPQLGVRDTRRVKGDYVVTQGDLASGTEFPDTIAVGAYPIDVHKSDSEEIVFVEFPEDHHYNIPYRALLPESLRNVIAAGRGISATHEAFAALRVMPTAMAMGHAAGNAAAMAAATHQGEVRAVDPEQLRKQLVAENAYLGG